MDDLARVGVSMGGLIDSFDSKEIWRDCGKNCKYNLSTLKPGQSPGKVLFPGPYCNNAGEHGLGLICTF